MDDKKYKVILRIETYINDNGRGFFNYKLDQKDIKKNSFLIDKSCYILRRDEDNDIQKIEANMEFRLENSVILFRIRESLINNSYEIINPIRENMHKKEKYIKNLYYNNAWYAIKSRNNYNEDYILNEDDIIKLGPKIYEIIKLIINKRNIEEDNLEEINKYNISKINKKKGTIFNINLESSQYINDNLNINKKEEEQEMKKKECKECGKILSNKDLNENPLLKLCLCKNYIHYKCLKEKLTKNVKMKLSKNKNVIKYICENFYCNECKMHYPLRFKISEQIYELINFINFSPKTDFMVLESLNYEKNNSKIIYFIKFNNIYSFEEIHFGRSEKKNDIIDEELSELHAVIKYDKKKGNIILEDKVSTYGSSVLIKGNIKLKEEKINIQIGRSYISAKINC